MAKLAETFEAARAALAAGDETALDRMDEVFTMAPKVDPYGHVLARCLAERQRYEDALTVASVAIDAGAPDTDLRGLWADLADVIEASRRYAETERLGDDELIAAAALRLARAVIDWDVPRARAALEQALELGDPRISAGAATGLAPLIAGSDRERAYELLTRGIDGPDPWVASVAQARRDALEHG